MIEIPILPQPNQRFTVTLGGHLWDVTIKKATISMVATVRRDGEIIIRSSRIVSNAPIIPFRYLATAGNFQLQTIGDQEPDWQLFGDSQHLFFLEPDQ